MSTLHTSPPDYIEVDERGRTSLKRFMDTTHRFYAVERLGGGALVLRPAQLVTSDDLALTNRPDILEEIEAAAGAPEAELTDIDLAEL